MGLQMQTVNFLLLTLAFRSGIIPSIAAVSIFVLDYAGKRPSEVS